MDWRIKGLLQKLLSSSPAGYWLNDRLQRLLGDLRDFENNVDRKIEGDWLVLLDHMRELSISPKGLDYLEVGTGWYPTLPICYSLAGAKTCRTYDVNPHMDEELTFRMLRRVERHLPAIAEAIGSSLDDVKRDYARLISSGDLKELLERARIGYVAPGDASETGLPDASVDVVFSNSVLEHVPAGVIDRIMKESARILRPNGMAIHSVNCGDHYAYFDRSITQIHYLQFTEQEWSFWNTSLQYQNRMRPMDFLQSAEKYGLKIVLKKHRAKPELLELVGKMKIAPEFQKYPPEQLACTSIDFVAARA